MRTVEVSAGDSRVAAPPGFGHRTWRGLGSTDLATRRRNRERKDKVDSSSRAGDRRELDLEDGRSSSGRLVAQVRGLDGGRSSGSRGGRREVCWL
jgi:hypothetical protein